jgi:general secretion pathway protein C
MDMLSYLTRVVLLSLVLIKPALALGNEMPFKVLGVIASNHEQKSFALIKYPSNKTQVIKVGSAIDQQYQLESVSRKEVVVRNGEQRYIVGIGEVGGSVSTMPHSTPSNNFVSTDLNEIEFKGDTVQVSATLRDHLVNNDLNKILMQAAALPQYQDGRLIGFALWEIEPGSVYEKVGLRNGDVVSKINGTNLSDVAMTIKLLRSLRNESNASMTVVRNGVEQTIKLVVQ